MRRLIPLLFALCSSSALAQQGPRDVTVNVASAPYGFGAGVVLGEPTGITLVQRDASDEWLLQGAFGWNPIHNNLHGQVDALFNVFMINVPQWSNVQFPVYAGAGIFVDVGEYRAPGSQSLGFGGRIPVGITFMDKTLPFDVFLETGLVGGMFPVLLLDIDTALGVRIYFL